MPLYTATATATASASATATETIKFPRIYLTGFGTSFTTGSTTTIGESDISLEDAIQKAQEKANEIAINDAQTDAITIADYKAEKNFLNYRERVLSNNNEDLSSNDKNLTATSTIYPWQYGKIQGYLLWQGNFVGSSPKTQYFFTKTTAPQISYEYPSNNVAGSGTYTYSKCTIPTNQGINCVVLFTGFSNIKDVFNNLTNYTTGANMYDTAFLYFKNNNITNYLLSLSIGGGTTTGEWNLGKNGAIYSIYEAVTKKGYGFQYTESSGSVLSGTGTGTLNSAYNSLFMDIETCQYGNGSTGQDFINLFNYIKKDGRSTFTNNDGNLLYQMIIIVSMAHSCSNYGGQGQDVFSTLYSDSTGSYDYICPQLYTQNVGSTNEYAANSNILWTGTPATTGTSFQSSLSVSQQFIQYGLNMILPAINLPNLYNTGGTNDGNPPNLYYYQYSSNNTNPPTEDVSGWITIPYTKDTGAVSFFNSIFGIEQPDIGGYIQWIDGTLTNIN